jgi:pSer/pThr/pTyr-binding forkhead associated (FHA) protein
LNRLELTVEAQPLAKLVRAWFQLLSVGRHEHSEEALPSNLTSPPHLESRNEEATRATEGKELHNT